MNNNINRPQGEDQGIVKKPNVFYILAFFTALIMLAMYGLGEMDVDFKNEFKKMKQEIVDNINNDGAPVVGGYSNDNNQTTTAANEVAPTTTTEPVDPNVDYHKTDALQKAREYLKQAAYSKRGLTDLLIENGIFGSPLTYAMKNLDVDWQAQAVRKAREYVFYKHWNKEDLYNQLINDKFTETEASYAVDKVLGK